VRLQAKMVAVTALALGGCLQPQTNPTVTGSLHPEVTIGVPADQPDWSEVALADAVLSCSRNRVQVRTDAFRRCVAVSQRAAMPGSDAKAPSGISFR
jgi:hypothetical protein